MADVKKIWAPVFSKDAFLADYDDKKFISDGAKVLEDDLIIVTRALKYLNESDFCHVDNAQNSKGEIRAMNALDITAYSLSGALNKANSDFPSKRYPSTAQTILSKLIKDTFQTSLTLYNINDYNFFRKEDAISLLTSTIKIINYLILRCSSNDKCSTN